MTFNRKLCVLLGVSSLSFGISTASQADINLNGDVTGNIAATSTYVWRGAAQTVDAAIQGGINYSDPQGIHAGIWTSNVAAGSELDLIFGYAGATNGIDFDAGVIFYRYPQYTGADFEEFYVGISQGALSAQFANSSDVGTYIEVAGSFPVKSWEMTAHFGSYSRKAKVGEDYADYSVTFTKALKEFDVGFMLSDTDLKGDDYRTVVTVSTEFKP